MTTPAVTLRSSPVIPAESSDARYTQVAATSSGRTMRRSGDSRATSARTASSAIPRMAACRRSTSSIRGPATKPGQTALTAMPCGPSSAASVRTSPMTPIFAAA